VRRVAWVRGWVGVWVRVKGGGWYEMPGRRVGGSGVQACAQPLSMDLLVTRMDGG
jgi:hypothetical protein